MPVKLPAAEALMLERSETQERMVADNRGGSTIGAISRASAVLRMTRR